jgi:hypothetical protein
MGGEIVEQNDDQEEEPRSKRKKENWPKEQFLLADQAQ